MAFRQEDPMTAKINSRITVHQSRVFNLIRENVTLDNGITADLEFLEHPGATAVIAMTNDSRILLLKQYRHSLREYIWEIPAGTIDPQESVISCAKRELIEETGFSAGQWQHLAEITPVPGYSNERIYIYLATDLHLSGQDLDHDEIISVHQVNFKEAFAMIKQGEIRDAKSITGLYLAFEWLSKNDDR